MGNFFHGWRRKGGVLTLVVVLALVSGWVRSFRIQDTVRLFSYRPTEEIFLSSNGCLMWMRDGSRNQWIIEPGPENGIFEIWHAIDDTSEMEYYDFYINYRWRFGGFAVGDPRDPGATSYGIWMLPYWSLVLPLTMISAYLLIVKPRKPNSLLKKRDRHLGMLQNAVEFLPAAEPVPVFQQAAKSGPSHV
jgi:hypothetical protein